MKKLLAALVLVSATLLGGCGGGGEPSRMAQFEPGLVGQYELVEMYNDYFAIIHVDGDARLGDMLLQDNNSFEQNFNRDAYDYLGYFGAGGRWSATLSTITFNGMTMGYDTSKLGDIGADIGDTLTIDDPFNDITFVWVKITVAPRN